jgi:hypothetical protein
MNMSKRALTLGIASLGLVMAFGSQLQPVAVNTPPAPPVMALAPAAPIAPAAPVAPVAPATPGSYSGDNWSFNVPEASADSWTKIDTDHDEVLVLLMNHAENRKIMFLGLPFNGPEEMFPAMMVKGIAGEGGKVTTNKNVTINSNNFKYVVASQSKTHATVHVWMTVKAKTGYLFMCGGASAKDLASSCETITSTLQIK